MIGKQTGLIKELGDEFRGVNAMVQNLKSKKEEEDEEKQKKKEEEDEEEQERAAGGKKSDYNSKK